MTLDTPTPPDLRIEKRDMKFGRVQGHASQVEPGVAIALVVSLDTGARAEVIRQEQVPWLPFGPVGDAAWQIDQYTQETIGTVLAADGWETISVDEAVRTVVNDGMLHSPTYIVRQL